MTQPIPDGVLVLLPDCYNSPITKKGEVYGAVIWRSEDSPNSLSREVVRVALNCINQSEESASIPGNLLLKHPHYSPVSTKEENLDLVVVTYDESSVLNFISKIKTILQNESQPTDPWETADSVENASLIKDPPTSNPIYFKKRPFIRWTFKTSEPQVSSLWNHIRLSGSTHSVVVGDANYSIDMRVLGQIRNSVSNALDNIAEIYQSMHKQELLTTLGWRDVFDVNKTPQKFSYDKGIPLALCDRGSRYIRSLKRVDYTATLSTTILIVSLVVLVVLFIDSSPSERTHL